jgi:hypothetical protein
MVRELEDDEYEIVQTSPIRRLEKRLSKIEGGSSSGSGGSYGRVLDEIVELVTTNQKIVDDLVRSNIDLRNEISRLPGKMDELIKTMNEFINILKLSAEEETAGGMPEQSLKPLAESMNKMVDYNKKVVDMNQSVLTALESIDSRLRRLYVVPPSRIVQPTKPSLPERRLKPE